MSELEILRDIVAALHTSHINLQSRVRVAERNNDTLRDRVQQLEGIVAEINVRGR